MQPGARPDQVPRWGSSSTMVQPAEGVAAAGFATQDRPPAQWLNWMWNRHGAWIDFLRGPNIERWTRVSTGAEIDSESHRQFAIDTANPQITDAFRYAFVVQDSGTTKIRVSKTCDEWETRTNAPASGAAAITALDVTATNWILGDDSGNFYYGAIDDGTGTGPVGANGNAWTTSSTVSVGVVRGFAAHGSRVFALTSSSGAYSDDDGVTWTAYSVSGTARSGDGWSVVYDGAQWVFCTQSGQAYASSDGASFAFKSSFSGTSAVWQLAAGHEEVIAYRYTTASSVMYRSTDHGATWSTVTPSSTLKPVKVTSLRWANGQWLATSDVAPYLWSSNDLEAWHPLRPPVTGSASKAVGALAWDGSAWVAVGRSFALVCGRAADSGGATYNHEEGAITYADAAYLRGREVSDATPADGEVLTWSDSLDQWIPAAGGGGGGVPSGSAGDVVTLDGAGGETAVSPLAVGAKSVDIAGGTVANTGAATGTRPTGAFVTTFGVGAAVNDQSEVTCSWPIAGITYELTYRVRHAVASSGNRVGIVRVDLGDAMAGHYLWIETDEAGNTTVHYDGSGSLGGWSPSSPSLTMWVRVIVDGNRVAAQAAADGVFTSYLVDNSTVLPTFSVVSGSGKITATSIRLSGKQVTAPGDAAATVTIDNVTVKAIR